MIRQRHAIDDRILKCFRSEIALPLGREQVVDEGRQLGIVLCGLERQRVLELTLEAAGGEAIQSKSGHSFIKEKMREVDAIYGGEMSAHHYFRDFYYCDTGMVPWLLVAQLLCTSQASFSSLVDAAMEKYPTSGEINREVPDAAAAIKLIRDHYEGAAESVDTTDGVSLAFADWRFNLRASNTEPVIRLNVETRGDTQLMQDKRDELLALLDDLKA